MEMLLLTARSQNMKPETYGTNPGANKKKRPNRS